MSGSGKTDYEAGAVVRSVVFDDQGRVITERTVERPVRRVGAAARRPRSTATLVAATATDTEGAAAMSNENTASARRQQHEREIEAAVNAGRIPGYSGVRAAWVAAFERDETAARRELAAKPEGACSAINRAAATAGGPQPGSLDRALRAIPGRSTGAALGELPKGQR